MLLLLALDAGARLAASITLDVEVVAADGDFRSVPFALPLLDSAT